MSTEKDPYVLLSRVTDAAKDLCHLSLENQSGRVAALEELLWRLYEGLYGHRNAEGIDPFKTAVGGALEVKKAWDARGGLSEFDAVGWWDGRNKQALWEKNREPSDGALLFRPRGWDKP